MKPTVRYPWIARQVRSRNLLPDLTAGLLVGLLSVAMSISFAALVYNGALAPFLGQGIVLAVFGSVVTALAVALFGSLPGAAAIGQDAPAVILGVMGANIVARLPGGTDPRQAFLTVVVASGLTALATGIAYLAVGTFRLANLVRFLPYPVVGGFLAGTGWLLLVGGLSVLTHLPLGSRNLGEIGAVPVGLWLPGVVLGALLVYATRRVQPYLALTGGLAAAAAVFFAVMLASGNSLRSWGASGLFLGPFPQAGTLPPFRYPELGHAHWGLVVGQAGAIGSVVVLALIALLLNTTGLELVGGRDADLDRELRVAGVGNVLAGLAGGLPGYHALSLSTLNHQVGTGSRRSSLTAVAVLAAALVAGVAFLAFVPRLLVGGLLAYLGMGLLFEWVVQAYPKLPRGEYALVLVILATIGLVGFLQGVAVGVVAAVLLFVLDYSRAEVVRHALPGSAYPSRVHRDGKERAVLEEHGEELLVLELQGFLFFGTANGLVERVRRRLRIEPPLRSLVLDFKHVTGLDVSGALSFAKLADLAGRSSCTLVLSDVPDGVRSLLARDGRLLEAAHVRFAGDLDTGLEDCEEALLARDPSESPKAAVTADEAADGAFLPPEFRPYLERVTLEAGDTLVRQGERADAVYFLESGQLTARLEGEDHPVRLETMRGGTVVGELAFYANGTRTATVKADRSSTVQRLSRGSLERMTSEAPEAAAALHELVARLMADRVTHLMRAVDTLQR